MGNRKPGPPPAYDAGDAGDLMGRLDANGGTFTPLDNGKRYPTPTAEQVRAKYELMQESQLHKMADDSHAVHRNLTGQVPEDDGYKTYVHQGPYAKPSEDNE